MLSTAFPQTLRKNKGPAEGRFVKGSSSDTCKTASRRPLYRPEKSLPKND
jgi:hypothetical protein